MTGKRVLMIAYHFPPLAGSSGVQRALRFVQYLPSFGWEPIVLTVRPHAYESTSNDLLAEIPPGTVVHRAFALDTARHISVYGHYPRVLALPDRWVSWKLAGIRAGKRLIREHAPRVIWSTYPIATAHLIGGELSRLTDLPWIADFRDPMAHEGYPPDPHTWRAFKRVEEFVFAHAKLCTFTTAGAADMYRKRYPDAPRIAVLQNGYDHDAFALAEQAPEADTPLNPGCLTLLHSGIIYPDERDPTALFRAIAQLKASNEPIAQTLRIRFRAPVHDELLRRLAADHGLAGMIEILPLCPYRDALVEMLRADGLLVLQAANCDDQIPAKVYEYLRARKPILAFVNPGGETGRALAKAGIVGIVPLDDPIWIAETLKTFLDTRGQVPKPNQDDVAGASRFERTRQLAGMLDELAPC